MSKRGGKRGWQGAAGRAQVWRDMRALRHGLAAACVTCGICLALSAPAAGQTAKSGNPTSFNTLSFDQNEQWWDHSSRWGVNNVLDQERRFNLKGGMRVGRFAFAPTLDTRVVYDDNVFNRTTNRKGDFYTEITPGIRVSAETARHFFTVAAGLKGYKYAKYDAFDAIDWSISGAGGIHINSAHIIYGTVSHALQHEQSLSYLFPDVDGTRPTAPDLRAAERTPVTATTGEVGIKRDGGRLYGSLGGRFGTWDYQDVRGEDGSVLDQDYRDLRMMSGVANLGYRFSPGYELVGSFISTRLDFLNAAAVFADGWRHEAYVGLKFETGPLLKWQLGGGYAYRTYDQPTYQPAGSYTARLAVNWAATERLTIKAEAQRRLSSSATETSVSSSLAHGARVNADLELYRNLIFTINGEYWDIADQDSPTHSNIYGAGVRLQYFSTQNWVASVGYDYIDQRSNSPGSDLKRNQFWGRLSIKF